MNIEKNKVVAISYELRPDGKDNDVAEKVEVAEPLQFVFGVGYMLPAFEAKLNGLTAGKSLIFR